MREPKVGDWVCYQDSESTGTELSVIEYIIDKGISGFPAGKTERLYVTYRRVLSLSDILEVRGKEDETAI